MAIEGYKQTISAQHGERERPGAVGPQGQRPQASLTGRVKSRKASCRKGALRLSPEGRESLVPLGVSEELKGSRRYVCRDGKEMRVRRGQAGRAVYMPDRAAWTSSSFHQISSALWR